jgi:myo-inositol catabolism protein IolC
MPLIYELLVPATAGQLAQAGGDAARYDRELRPDLVTRLIAENQDAEVEPALWKVEGLETTEAALQVADQVRAGGRDADLIVLGRDAPAERLNHWLAVAAQVEAFVGFAIGRSIWEDAIRGWRQGHLDDAQTSEQVTRSYLAFCEQWRHAAA